jgi:adenosine deaminase
MVELEPKRMLVALAQMPKAEMHLHLEGTPRWSTVRELNFNVATVDRLKLDLETVRKQLAASVATPGDRGIPIRIIVGIDRAPGSENARLQVARMLPYPVISGFDLHGLETPETRADRFQDAWAIAQDAGRKVKVHAGEMDGPASIHAAVATPGITQIGHGTSAIESPEVLNLL